MERTLFIYLSNTADISFQYKQERHLAVQVSIVEKKIGDRKYNTEAGKTGKCYQYFFKQKF